MLLAHARASAPPAVLCVQPCTPPPVLSVHGSSVTWNNTLPHLPCPHPFTFLAPPPATLALLSRTFHGLSCDGPEGGAPLELMPGFQTHEHSRYLYTFNVRLRVCNVMSCEEACVLRLCVCFFVLVYRAH